MCPRKKVQSIELRRKEEKLVIVVGVGELLNDVEGMEKLLIVEVVELLREVEGSEK